jgi:hypothetical protein
MYLLLGAEGDGARMMFASFGIIGMTIVIHAHAVLKCCGLLDTWEGISNGPSAVSKTNVDLTDHQKQLRLLVS